MKQAKSNRKGYFIVAAAAAVFAWGVVGPVSRADTLTWLPADSNWTGAENWLIPDGSTELFPGDNSGTVTNNADTALFNDNSITDVSVTAPSINIQNLQFDSDAGSFTFTGGPFLLSAGGSVQMLGSVTGTGLTESINTDVVLEGDYSFINSSNVISGNVLSFGGNITNGSASAAALTLDGTSAISISGNISDGGAGALSLVKNGTNVATLSGTNTYTGSTTVNNGVLLFGSTASIAGSGASINVGANGAVGDVQGLSDPGFLSRINNTGTGTLALTAADSTSTLDFTSGSLAAFSGWYLGGGDGSTFTGTIIPTAAGYKFGGNGALTVGTNLGGNYAVTVGNGASTGVITFSGTNTYTGGTVLNSGVTIFQTPAAIGGTGQNLQVNAPAAVSSGTGISDSSFLARISPTSTGALAITSADAATNFDFTSAPFNAVPNMAIGTNGNVTYTGVITPANNTYRVGGGVGTMTFPNADQFTGANDLVISGNVEIDGSNSMTGNTTVNHGTLSLGGGTAATSWVGTGSVTLVNSTLQLNGYGRHSSGDQNFTNTVNVPAGSNSTIDLISYGDWTGSLTGAGTVNIATDYVRAGVGGDWSAFAGQINLEAVGAGRENIEISNASATNLISAPNAKVNVDNVLLYLGHHVNPANGTPSVISWGELDGTATAELGGQEAGGYPGRVLIWQIGSLNTDSFYAGTITDQAQKTAPVGATGLSKVGTGKLTLTGNNTYGGPTTVSDGILQIGDGGTTGSLGTDGTTSGPVTLTSPGVLAFDRSDGITVPHNISGTGQLVQMGAGTLTLTGTNSYTGGTLVNAGTLEGTPTALSGSITLAGGNLTLDGSGTTAMVVGGSGIVNKINSGAIKFSSAQTFTGALNVHAGSLELSGANASDITVDSGASLVASSADEFSVNSLQLGNSSGDATTLLLNNGSTLTSFSVTGNNGLSAFGTVTLDLGTVTLTPGDHSLISYSGAIGGQGFNAFTTSALSPRVVASLVNTGSSIDLDVSSVDAPKWTGAINGNWDINSTQNWKLITAGTTTTYLQPSAPGDAVLFDDSATGTTTVNVTTTVQPLTFTVNNSSKNYTFTGSGKISGATSLIKEGTGTMTISNTGGNDWTGGTQILGGTLTTGVANALPAAGNLSIDNGATLDLGGNSATFSGAVSLINGTIQNGTINKSGADYDLQSGTVSAQLNGSAGLTKSGDGTVVLTNASNGYTGATTINAGTLQYGDGSATLPLPSAITNNANLDWKIAGTDAVTYLGLVSGGGTDTVDMSSGASLTIAGAQAFAGPTVINGGSLILNGSTTAPGSDGVSSLVGGTLTLNNGATLTASGYDVFGLNTKNPVTSLVLNAGTTATITAGSSTELYNNLVLNGGTLNGDGTWSIHGSPDVTADSLISSAALNVDSNRTLTIDDGVTLTVTSPSLTGGGTLTVQGSGNSGVGTGIMALDSAVSNSLTGLTLHGAEFSVSADTNLPPIANAINFTGGTLQITGTTLTTIDNHTAVNWSGFQGGFDIADASNVFTVASVISDTTDATPVVGSLSKSGPGTLVISGANTYSGGTTISDGILQTPALADLGTGTITINGGALVVTDASALATLGSDLTASYDKGAWDLGTFRSNATLAIGRSLGYDLVNGQAEVMYTLPGDANLDGSVNHDDLAAMSPTGTTWYQGDFNYDGVVNSDDLSLYMLGAAYGSLPTSVAPEPAAAWLLAVGAAGALCRRRRRA